MTRLRALLLTLAALGCGGAEIPAPRSLLLITLDTTRADYLSCLGGPPGVTPHLDALAARAALFTNARSETNVTNPSHLTILSGLPAIEHGVFDNSRRVPRNLDTLATAFQRAGHATAAFLGVRHLAQGIGWRGFDVLPDVRGYPPAREVANRALAWMQQARHPFFLWVHFYDPHFDYDPPRGAVARFYTGDPKAGPDPLIRSAPYFEIYPDLGFLAGVRDRAWPRALYAAEVHTVDAEVGRLLGALERMGLGGDTAVVVAADHGESLGEHDIYYSHRGIYEPQLRIPLIVHVPGLPPTRSTADVSTLDIAPTLADLFGLELDHELPGIDLMPLLRGEELPALDERRVHVHQNAHNHAVAVRQGSFKLILSISDDHPLLSRPPQLFDLEHDPGEERNLAEQQPERVAALREIAKPWIQLGPAGRAPSHLSEEEVEGLRGLGYLD